MESERKAGSSSRIRFVALVIVCLAAYWWVTRPVESAVVWKTDFEAAVSEAKSRAVPLFVDFYADWCGPCKSLDARVLSSQDVAAVLGEDYVPVRVDLTSHNGNETNELVAARYGVQALPTLLVVDPTSLKVIARAGNDTFEVEGMLAFLEKHGG